MTNDVMHDMEKLLAIIEGAPKWNIRPLDSIEEMLYRAALEQHQEDAPEAIRDLLETCAYRPSIAELHEACRLVRRRRLERERDERRELPAPGGVPMPSEVKARLATMRADAPTASALEHLRKLGQIPTPGEEDFDGRGNLKRGDGEAGNHPEG